MEKQRSSTRSKRAVAFAVCNVVTAIFHAFSASAQPAVTLSKADALRIGKRVWQNECSSTISGLTSWNEGEDFASLGIGHFIWYPEGNRGPFEESFPKFLAFAASRGVDLPDWLRPTAHCPWKSRADFARAQKSPRMGQLRQFLTRTVDLQAQFMVSRLQDSLAKMMETAPVTERDNVREQFDRLAGIAQGCYALVDYVNFKGEGTLATERYRGQGWGLLQVLEKMHGTGHGVSAPKEFSRSAEEVLRQRVKNSPPARKESRWLPGWVNRVRTYAANS